MMSKPKENETIEINGDVMGAEFLPIKAKVRALLNVQFTAAYMDGTDTTTYRFYADEGTTWRKIV